MTNKLGSSNPNRIPKPFKIKSKMDTNRKYLKYMRKYWEIQLKRHDMLQYLIRNKQQEAVKHLKEGTEMKVPINKEFSLDWSKLFEQSQLLLDRIKDIGELDSLGEKLRQNKTDFEHLQSMSTYYAVILVKGLPVPDRYTPVNHPANILKFSCNSLGLIS